MSVAIKIEIKDDITPSARMVQRGLQPDRLFPIIGRSATNTIREHLFGLNQIRPNALGGPRTNFYASAARSTHFDVVPGGVQISINHIGIAQRYFGGKISAGQSTSSASGKPTKYLTIPARAEAYGKRASEFPDLIVLRRGGHEHGEPFALARAVQDAVSFRRSKDGRYKLLKGGERGGEILFWLKKEIDQEGDKTVLPYDDLISSRLDRDVGSYVDQLVQRAGGTPATEEEP